MKKLLSLLLAVAMVFTMTVMPAVAETAATVVYIVNGDVETTVTDVVVNETYVPDHMPAAPSGKYFAGWKDANGNYVLENGMTIAEGENALYAYFVDYPVEEKAYLSVEGLQTREDSSPIVNAPVVNTTFEGTEKFFPSYRSEINGGYIQREYVTEGEGAPYIKYGSNASGTNMAVQMLYDENGVAYSGKYSTNYQIIVKFSVPESNGATFAIVPGFGVKYNRINKNGVEDYNVHTAKGDSANVVPKKVFPRPSVDGGEKLAINSGWVSTFCVDGSNSYYMSTDPNTSANYIGEAGETVHTAVYTFTTSAAEANVAPYFTLTIKAGEGETDWLNTLEIKEVTIVDPSAAKVQYVENGKVVDTVSNLAAGAKYAPDRMPTAEAEDGKYFAGWTNADGNYILKDGITLAAGENKLYAKYVDYPTRNTSSGTLDYINNPTFALGSFDANGENYLNYVDGTGDYLTFSSVELDGEKVWKLSNGNSGGSRANFIIPNADGSAMQIEPGNKYTITITYKVPNHSGKNPQMFFGGGLAFLNGTTDNRLGLKTSYQGIAKNDSTLTSTSDPYLDLNGQLAGDILSGSQQYRYLITGASTEWQTATYTLNTSANYTGFLPVIQGFIHLPASYEMYIKEIVVDNLDWVAPATVTYYVGDKPDGETVTNLKEGNVFNPDRIPNAEAEDGKFFIGWKTEGGEMVTADGITLAEGENKLYAAYADAPVESKTVKLDNPNTVNDKLYNPYVYNETYNGFIPFEYNGNNGNNGPKEAVTEGDVSYTRFTSGSGTGRSATILFDENAVPVQAKWNTTYTVTFKYRMPNVANKEIMIQTLFGIHKEKVNSAVITDMTGNLINKVATAPELSSYYGGTFKNGANEYRFTSDPSKNDNATSDRKYNIVESFDEWKTLTFVVNTGAENDDYLPIFALYVSVAGNYSGNIVDIQDVTVKECSFATAEIEGNQVKYAKIADDVEDKQTYKVTLYGAADSWADIAFMTADSNSINSNAGYIEAANKALVSFGYGGTYKKTVYITIDKAGGQGDALYLYIPKGAELVKQMSVLSVEKVTNEIGESLIGNGGVSKIRDLAPDATQALRYYFTYDTTTGNNIIIDGQEYEIKSRGFLIANADKIYSDGGEKLVTRASAKEGSGIIDTSISGEDLLKCWEVTDADEDGINQLTFSTYVTGFKAENGTSNNTQRLYVKGYVVIQIEDKEITLYSEESKVTVKEVTDKFHDPK